ncbi:hypothetical protein AAHA92_03182 [Salvia divinorum]|uniref:Myb/SANT-like domain-containing protein n=1 Tax=Salvia divinorum TaxID=28513 RepID=A0ABD1IGV9_SALDI
MGDGIPNQSFFLYEYNWTPTIDSLLLRTITKLKRQVDWDGTVFPSHYILQAEAAIKRDMGVEFAWSDLLDRLHFLERRYKTFKEVLDLEGTFWEVHTNTIIVVDEAWQKLLQRNPLAGAYYYKGEPAYYELTDLFDLNTMKVEPENTVIMISDSMESTGVVAYEGNPPPRVRHEVEVPKYDPVARRKLLFDGMKPDDCESTNNRGLVYYVMKMIVNRPTIDPHRRSD